MHLTGNAAAAALLGRREAKKWEKQKIRGWEANKQGREALGWKRYLRERGNRVTPFLRRFIAAAPNDSSLLLNEAALGEIVTGFCPSVRHKGVLLCDHCVEIRNSRACKSGTFSDLRGTRDEISQNT